MDIQITDMQNPPILSVLMPVFNGREFLRPAIDSVLSQTFSDFELIIVNDGSTDDTQSIIDSYSDPRIVAVNQVNQGVARALNNGLDIARGRYVRRHDADDVSTPDSFRIQIDFLEARPEYVMVCNQEAFMTASGMIAWHHRVPNASFFNDQPFVDLDFKHFATDRSSPVVHGTACYRREEVIGIGKYRTEFIVAEDNDLWLRLLEKYKIAVLNQCTYFMRLHGSSATQRHASRIRHFRQILIDFSEQRRTLGTDPIMRGEPLPIPETHVNEPAARSIISGKNFREDLRYIYGLVVDARDWKEIKKYGRMILHDGWKDFRTWKMLLFPFLGSRMLKTGVAFKSVFRSG